MNFDQFNESMKRVLAFTLAPKTPTDTENLNRYMRATYEAIGTMDAYLFEKVTVEICKNMGRGQRPMPGQFWAVYSRLRAEQKASQPAEVCPSCRNTVWTMVLMMESKTGIEALFAEPCPGCQHRHPLKDAPPRAGWIKVERAKIPHDQEMLEKAATMGAKGARFVLDLVEKFRVNFSEEVILKLVERAGDEPSTPPSGPTVKALESLKVEPSKQPVLINGEQYEIEE
jgi:hypothetical protein